MGRTARKYGRVLPTATVAIMAMVAGLLSSSSAPAVTPGGAQRERPLPIESLRQDAVDRMDAASSLVSSGRLENAVHAAAALQNIDLASLPKPKPAKIAAVPLPVRGVVGRLVSAIALAGEEVNAAVPRDEKALQAAQRELSQLSETLSASLPNRARFASSWAAAEAARDSARFERLVDRRRLYSAALLVARAIDDAVPTLKAYAKSTPPMDRAVKGCGVVDLPPLLCMGQAGSNHYDSDYALLIDMGGSDVYSNSAGGADPLHNGLPVSVVVDLSGDDRYETAVPTASGVEAVQGGGVRGIGILADLRGADRYSAANNRRGLHVAAGQGFGFAGVGMLADLGGAGSSSQPAQQQLELRNEGEGNSPLLCGESECFGPVDDQRAYGQGVGLLGGAGILVGPSAGPSSAEVAATPRAWIDDAGAIHPGSALAYGYGVGALGGVGLFADTGSGSFPSMRLRAASAPVAPDETHPLFAPEQPPRVVAMGFGAGYLGGVGAVYSAPGNNQLDKTASEEIIAESSGVGVLNTQAVGFGFGGAGIGLVRDGSGDDSYILASNAAVRRTVSVDDNCACSAASSVATMGWGGVPGDDAWAVGLGVGALGGAGVFQDSAGNDRYLTTATDVAQAVLIDGRTGTQPRSATAQALAKGAFAFAQGAGIGDQGAGFFEDDSGNDAYATTTESRATAEVMAANPGGQVSTSATSGLAASGAQAYAGGELGSYGELIDLGGQDIYSSRNHSSAETSPEGTVRSGREASWVQASTSDDDRFQCRCISAAFVDHGGGLSDTFTAEPANPACLGERGGDLWIDCRGGPTYLGQNS